MNKQNEEIRIKKNLVKFLLNDDITPFKKLIPEILSLDSEVFNNLFEGIERDDYYNFGNKNMLKKLIWKFNNFNMLLESWYDDKKYYPFIKELWISYAPIEQLKNNLLKNKKLFEEQMETLGINYKDWPSDIKYSFINIIKSTSKTIIFDDKIIRQLKNEFKEEMRIIEELILTHQYYIDLKNEEENKGIAENAKILAFNFGKNYVIGKALNFLAPNAIKSGKFINAKNVLFNEFKFTDADKLAKTLIDYYESDYYKKRPDWLEKGHIDELIKKIQLGFKQKVKYFYDNNYICALHTVLSFINIGYSVYKLTQAYQDSECVDIYKKELNDIVALFQVHKKSIGSLPDDFDEAKKIVDKYLLLFHEDQKRLHNLIMKIHETLKEQDKSKNNAFGRLFTSSFLTASSSIGFLTTSGPTAIFYGASTLFNAFSAIANTKEIQKRIQIIEDLNKIIEEADKENTKINNEIANLCNELKGKKTLGNPNYTFK